MQYDSIIFDIDGTLWDATVAVTESWNETLEKLGVAERVTLEEIKSVMGQSLERCVEILLPEIKIPQEKVCQAILENNFSALARKEAIVYDGVKEGMDELSKSYKIFIVSNCGENYLNVFLDVADIGSYITAYDCFGLSHLSKAEMIGRMKEKYFLKNPVYIGDTTEDLEGARGAGTDFIHAAYGFGRISEKVVSVNSFNDLINYLEES